MALHVINLSIDTPDRNVCYSEDGETHEDPTINDMESLIEFVLEEGFGLDNVVPEHDEPDEDSDLTKLNQDYFFTPTFRLLPPVETVIVLPTLFIPDRTDELLSRMLEISSPPPQRKA
ncbi:hypothetical protein [Siphonobacter sp. SORGH_AS_0500]|uniref:hypothetical protein n=2 Tax=Siphonobacter TaxID=700450 RepID=UPI000CAC84C1|nr:hypothetical protein [Siphonobacter sp. SORGH_AS_0500]MDR6197653.1 hypothetical protein [Siphonobacter sp. SORGH_AS_0500]PKK35024.1 hypothetical protein BWI96_19030 [Siphonobacter sp. SORGH_AS_0500]